MYYMYSNSHETIYIQSSFGYLLSQLGLIVHVFVIDFGLEKL